jgi:hypothetical protein
VVVHDRHGHAGALGDLAHRRAAVAALGEHVERGLLDELAALVGGQPGACGL